MAPLAVSHRGGNFEASPIIVLENRRFHLEREGRDVVNFSGGEADLPTPQGIVQAGVRALQEGYTRYTEDAGLPELREALCRKMARENGLRYSPDEVIITGGSKWALFMALQVLCDPGDEVLIPSPYWPTYREQVRLAGARARLIPTHREHGFKVTGGELAAAVSEKTKGLILNNPSNPTGAVYTREELGELVEICAGEGLFVLADEIYEHFVFDGPGHVSIAALGEEIGSRTITVGGCSKNYSMTGWRVGYGAGPAEVIAAMRRLQSQTTSSANAAAQKAAAAALDGGPLTPLREELRVRRDALVAGLEGLPGFSVLPPAGGFYVFARIPSRSAGPAASAALASALLEEASVALLPGSAFGAEGYLRLTFAPTPLPRIEEGVRRLRDFLEREENL